MTPIRVVIADDHPVILGAFERMVASENDIDLVGSFTDGAAAVDYLAKHEADILVLDLSLPRKDGVAVMEALRRLGVTTSVVIWSAGFDLADVVAAVRQGAKAVVLKQMPPEYLLHCIRKVGSGESVEAESIRRSLDELQRNVRKPKAEEPALTPREMEVVSMVARGFSNAQIAQQLGIGIETIKTHLQNMYAKLGIATRVELSVYAKEKGLI